MRVCVCTYLVMYFRAFELVCLSGYVLVYVGSLLVMRYAVCAYLLANVSVSVCVFAIMPVSVCL